ncbi:hypothetical protein NNC19_07125 [Clostridium sp. SHJSY1]|uniref:hypothetical protein n=1 Tax=Clostridium sp. SHJSY1 TaxID=2942483 RepID=UPI002874E9C9|nr:hypothetical protein [Clostridium sp. SHJSY1]MDS0525445.1 hypothetical protein [Clostridium sp. SHJSY1]
MSLNRTVNNAIKATYLLDKASKYAPKRKPVEFTNPFHKEAMLWAWVYPPISVVIMLFGMFFPPLMLAPFVLMGFLAFSKKVKLYFALETLKNACEVGDTKNINKYRAKAEKLIKALGYEGLNE